MMSIHLIKMNKTNWYQEGNKFFVYDVFMGVKHTNELTLHKMEQAIKMYNHTGSVIGKIDYSYFNKE